jgi:hypothetical protein
MLLVSSVKLLPLVWRRKAVTCTRADVMGKLAGSVVNR